MNSPLTITDAAAARIASMMNDEGCAGVRVGLKKGGCAGMEYFMEHVAEEDPNDMVVEQGDAKIMIAPTAQMFLLGTEIDYESTTLEEGFKFRNPNESESCGCGESVSFKIER